MTDQYEEQDVELNDDEEINEAEAHDPKNAEQQSIASVDKAGDATSKATKRPLDKNNPEPMPKTKAGILQAMYNKMNGMKKDEMTKLYASVMNGNKMKEEVEAEGDVIEHDFNEELNALVNSEATLSEEFKEKASIIFEAAINSKLSEEIERLEENYKEELAEEIERTQNDLVEKIDGYLNYVVEQWMEENKLEIQNGLRTEISEDFMNGLKNLFQESYIEVPESRVDLVDDLAEQVEELEKSLNEQTGKMIEMTEELELFKRYEVIREASQDLAMTEIEKLTSLVEDIEFEDEETFAKKVKTIKEAYFKKNSVTGGLVLETENDDDDTIEVSDVMSKYLDAIRKASK